MKSIPGPWMMVLLAGIGGACGRSSRGQDSGSATESAATVTSPKYQADTLPAGCALPTKPADLKTCTTDLRFDDLELAGDNQALSVCAAGTCKLGPKATIQPEKSSNLYREEDLSRGRIIARMFLNRGETARYAKLGMAPGDTTYWWVQKAPGDTIGKSAYLTVTGGTLVKKEFVLHFEAYRSGQFKQALARWLWVPNDEKTQGTCGSGTCR